MLYGLIVIVSFVAVLATLSKKNLLEFVGDAWSGARAKTAPASPALTLTVSGNQTYFWNSSGPYPLDGFADRFATWRKTNPRPEVRIVGDATGRWGDAVALFEEIRRQGRAAKIDLEPARATKP